MKLHNIIDKLNPQLRTIEILMVKNEKENSMQCL